MDIHAHSKFSDGSLKPSEIVVLAGELGLELIALTDHDTIAGQEDFLVAARRAGIPALTGLEADSRCEGVDAGWEIHLLAYGFTLEDARLANLLEAQRRRRRERNEEIVASLARLGYPVTLESGEDQVVNRFHIAQALVAGGHADSIRDAFKRFLGPEGMVRLDAEKLPAGEYIDLIHQLGGLVVWAHPLLMRGDWSLALEELCRLGLDGVEVYYPAHRADGMARLRRAAVERGLLITTGSDFHGANRPHIPYGALAEFAALDPLIQEAKARLTTFALK